MGAREVILQASQQKNSEMSNKIHKLSCISANGPQTIKASAEITAATQPLQERSRKWDVEPIVLAPDLGSLCPPTGSPGGWRPTHSPFLSQAALLSERLSQPAGHSQVWKPKVARSASEARSQAAGCGDAPGLVHAHRCPLPELAAPKKAGPNPRVIPASCW